MLLGQVLGSIVATQKDPELQGLKLLLVQTVDENGKKSGSLAVCVDAVGAGEGEVVLYTAGSSARQTAVTKNKPVDHVIIAIVDEVSLNGKAKFRKSDGFINEPR